MKSFWLKVFFQAVVRLVGSDSWEKIKEQVLAAEFLTEFSGEDKKKYVMERLQWLISDLKKGTSSDMLRHIMHILIAIAVDAVVAKEKIDTRLLDES